MVSVDKFFVYGGGRWREVDPACGRIDGWGRARFLVTRGGKLEAARSKPVLAALRALADKKPSAAKEGPQLPYKYPRFKSRERTHQGCEHQCCHHSNSGSACTSKSNDKKASIAIQCNKVDLSTHKKSDNTTTTQNSTTPKPIISTTNEQTNQKRKRISSSSEELFHSKGVTVATVHSPKKPDPKRPRISSNTLITRNKSTSSNETLKTAKSPRLLRRKPLKRRRSSSGQSIILESKSRTNQSRRVRSLNGSQLRRSARHNVSIVISDSDFEDSQRSRQVQYRQRSSTDEPLMKKLKEPKRIAENNATVNRITDLSTDEPISSGQKRAKPLKDEQIKHMLTKERLSKLKLGQNSSTDEPLNEIVKRTPGRSDGRLLRKASPKKSLERSSTDEPINLSEAKLKQKLGTKNIDEKLSSRTRSQKKGNTQDTSKELIIDEKDVAILRLFLENNYPDEDLLRFDTDDDYKKMHFYRINPLVNVERCPRIARMILDSQDDRDSLVVFASKLGLRSISEASSVKRYRTRRRDDKKRVEDIDKENERPSKTNVHKAVKKEREDRREREENERPSKTNVHKAVRKEREDRREREENERPSKTSNVHKAVRKEREDMRERENTVDTAVRRKEREDRREREENERPNKTSNAHKAKAVSKEREDMREREDTAVRRNEREDDRRERDNTKDTVELSNGSGEVKILKKKTKAVSKRPPLNEYSNLEDHAIVSWVSVGARACCVNGNRIWRELQGQYQRITGHERTWHSLRNRYLRYILPRLGALALPPALQTRLRAAAATGELKAKRRGAKRNSIFKPPTRGAFSRRPGLETHQDTVEIESGHEEDAAPSPPRRLRSPRYSDVTRQFAREHRYSSESSNKSTTRRNNNNITEKHNIANVREKSTRSSSAKDVLTKSRNRSEQSKNSSPSAKSRDVQGKSRKNIRDESSSGTEEQNKIIRKRSFSPQRRKRRSPSDSSHTDRSRSNSSDTDSSDPPDPPRRKSDRLRSPSGSPNRRRSNRINSPEPNRRRSNRINSLESNRPQSNRINSPEPNRRQSNRISPESNRRQSNRIKSPELNRRQSNRINSPDLNRRRSNRINSPEPNRRQSNRINSPDLNRRRSNRINSPEPNRRQSNRNKSPLDRQNKYRDSSADSSDSLPVQLNKRKSNRINSPETRQSNRVKSPIKTNSNSRDESKIQNSYNSLGESRRKQDRSNSPEFRSDSRRKSSRYKPETVNSLTSSQEKHDKRDDSSKNIRPRTRKLFNPKEIL